MPRAAQPGDGGPCPICSQEMREKVYMDEDVFGTTEPCGDRYWHMRHEHGGLKDYHRPPPLAERIEHLTE
jgi:hypothetical protein